MFDIRKSIHGRQLGISSSGGIVTDPAGSTVVSTGIANAAQMWGAGMMVTHTSTAAAITLRNYGTNVLSSATSTAIVASIGAAPVLGLYMEILSRSSATTVTIDSNSTTVVFETTGGTSSTSLTISLASTLGGANGETVALRGTSATSWHVLHKTGAIT